MCVLAPGVPWPALTLLFLSLGGHHVAYAETPHDSTLQPEVLMWESLRSRVAGLTAKQKLDIGTIRGGLGQCHCHPPGLVASWTYLKNPPPNDYQLTAVLSLSLQGAASAKLASPETVPRRSPGGPHGPRPWAAPHSLLPEVRDRIP